MKVEVEKPNPHFKPITVSFTIETIDEFEMCLDLFGLNVTIPENINLKHKETSYAFLKQIRHLLIKV